ncbi:putative CDC50/LEM3 family protein [Helianthus anomalus]
MVTQQELPACKPILTPKWVSIVVSMYVKSRSDQQLRNRGNETGTNTCKPEQKGHFMEE